jgi:signal peptidase
LRLLRWSGQVVAWLVILGVAGVLAVAVLIPRLAGATPYTVLTGSMRPHYPPGTLVVVKPVEADRIRTGDVVTYQLHSGRSAVVTHRVVAVRTSLDGATTFTTRGDANGVADAEPVRPVQIRGRLWYAVPHLGHLNVLVSGEQHQMLVLLAAGGLTGYAASMFIGALRDRSRREEESTP